MLTIKKGITFGIKNGTKYENFCLYDKPYMRKSNNIYADIGETLEDITPFVDKIKDFFNGPIVNVSTPTGFFKETDIHQTSSPSIKGQSFRVVFDYQDIYGFEATIYVPALKPENNEAFARILKELTWKTTSGVVLPVKEIKFRIVI